MNIDQTNSEEYWNKKYSDSSDWKRWSSEHRLQFYSWAAEEIDNGNYSVLDIGSGPGYGILRMKQLKPLCSFLGIDYSEVAVQKAVADVIRKDILKEKFKKNSFDYITCIETLEHFSQPHKIIQKMLPIARKKIIITVPFQENIDNHPEHLYSFSFEDFNEYNVIYYDFLQLKERYVKVVISNIS